MAPTSSSTGAISGSAATRSTLTTPNHDHTSTACLTTLDQQDQSNQYVAASLLDTAKPALRMYNSTRASVKAHIERMKAILENFDRVMEQNME